MKNSGWNGLIWEGVYRNFDEASGDVDVFSDSVWINKQHDQVAQKLSLLDDSVNISVLAESKDYYLPIILALQCGGCEGKIRVLDFGGGLASSYLGVTKALPANSELYFTIVENEEICKIGEKIFEDNDKITFTSSLPESEGFDTIHAGSALHYVDDWVGILKSFADYKPKYMIFADLPAGDIETYVTIQNFNGKKIPVRFWNLEQFINNVEDLGFRLIAKFRFSNRYVTAMCQIEEKNRLNYFSQLVFQRISND